MCTRQWDPVVVTATGVWQGQHVSWSGNDLIKLYL
ncbi:SSI family serine proteinase inhibitor [Streptomyces sp. NPDC006475]